MDWDKKAQENLLPLSKETENLEIALKEWYYTGTGLDHITPSETCQLCENTGLRYQFEIKNKDTENILLIGSDCILRFGIAVYGDNGELLEGKEKEKTLSDKIREFQVEVALEPLRQLWRIDKKNRRAIEYYVSDFKEGKGFAPEHLLFLFHQLRKYNINYEPAYYKVTVRSSWDKDELLNMSEDDLKLIWSSLSASQRTNYPMWKKKKQEENERLEREKKEWGKTERKYQEWLSNHPKVETDILDEDSQSSSWKSEQHQATISEQYAESFGKKEAACVICGQITNDWWYHDGATNTCKCNECKKTGKT